jgi:transcriptional regulator with XRE-family HTH domain
MYGKRIRDLRKEKGLSQKELADLLCFKSGSAIGMIEREERELSIEALNKLAEIFNTSTDYILGKTVEKTPGELDQLEQEFKVLFEKMKHISPDDRQIILKMIERFEQGNND